MADRLIDSLRHLARAKAALKTRERQMATAERRLIVRVERLLSSAGYRLAPLNGLPAAGPVAARGGAPKRLRCPECGRRFSHRLHIARHMSAKHRAAKAAGKPRSASKSKPAPRSRTTRKRKRAPK